MIQRALPYLKKGGVIRNFYFINFGYWGYLLLTMIKIITNKVSIIYLKIWNLIITNNAK